MSNLFQKIGNKIEKNKLEKKKREDKYWKLSAIKKLNERFKL